MKRPYISLVVFALLVGCPTAYLTSGMKSEAAPEIAIVETAPAPDVFFSPKGGCEAAIVAAIGAAKIDIHAQIYTFTSKPIAAALLAARARGVEVEVIIDRVSTGRLKNEFAAIRAAGGTIVTDRGEPLQHNKVLVIDGKVVITGSYNWTASADQRNAENLIVIESAELAQDYEDDFQKHLAHSQ